MQQTARVTPGDDEYHQKPEAHWQPLPALQQQLLVLLHALEHVLLMVCAHHQMHSPPGVPDRFGLSRFVTCQPKVALIGTPPPARGTSPQSLHGVLRACPCAHVQDRT